MNASATALLDPAPPVRVSVSIYEPIVPIAPNLGAGLSGTVRNLEQPEGTMLLDLIDFKWLMVGEGHLVDLDRLCNDDCYARGCLALARHSTSSTVRASAARAMRLLGRAA